MKPAAWLALLCLTCTSCINVSYRREHANEPIEELATDGLLPDRSTLGDVLTRLGAPTIVWPSLNGRVVMAYAWLDESGWGVSLSYNLRQFAAASLEWESEHAEIPAIVMEFDPDLQLRIIRRGLLRDIAPEPPQADASVIDVARTYR